MVLDKVVAPELISSTLESLVIPFLKEYNLTLDSVLLHYLKVFNSYTVNDWHYY